jgi:hypothetical protein
MIKSNITFHPEIFQILGEKLVSDPVIAISELVKNSYDADAENVIINIDTRKTHTIKIKDDGHGMSLDDIKDGWLIVDTPKKRAKDRSKIKGRVFTGSMGIGRLASFSLAYILTIITASHFENNVYTKISFSLNMKEILKFDNLGNFPVNIEYEKITNKYIVGTEIILSDLKWKPDESDINRLVNRLSVLCNPNVTSDFIITLIVNNENKQLNPEIALPASAIILKANIDENGDAFFSVEGNKNLYLQDLKRENYGRKSLYNYNDLKNVNLIAY